jgi:acyl dehydratase
MALSYGYNKVRFITPVKVGAKVRALAKVASVEEVKGGAVQATVVTTIEIEGSEKPAAVVESIVRYLA